MAHYDPYNFSPKNSLGALLKISHTLMHECGGRVTAGYDLSFVQWIILVKLKEGSMMTASDLCRHIVHDNGALTRVLDQLEERGLIERERSKQDRRVVNLKLTEAGIKLHDELTPQVVNNLNNALSGFSAEEFAQLVQLLEKLKSCLEDYTAEKNSDSQ